MRIRKAATSQKYMQKHAPWLSIVRGANNAEQLLFEVFLDMMRIFGRVEPQSESSFLFL